MIITQTLQNIVDEKNRLVLKSCIKDHNLQNADSSIILV